MNELQSKWFEPDERWRYFGGFTELEKYLAEMVIKGNFHDNVPEDISKSYKTVEFIMAHAFYHWPMYDEAYNKLLRIIEMALKFKAQELGIPVNHVKANGKETPKGMKVLVDQISKAISAPGGFKRYLERATYLRNWDSHPTHHSYSGGMLKSSSAMDMINLINILFLDHRIETVSKSILKELSFDYSQFANSCSAISETDQSSYFGVYDFEIVEAYEASGQRIYLIGYHPIVEGMVKGIEEDKHTSPVFRPVSHIVEIENGLRLKSLDGNEFTVFKTKNVLLKMSYDQLLKDFESLDKHKAFMYKMTVDNARAKQLTKHRYDYYWSN